MPEDRSKEVEIILTEYKSLREEILKKMDSSWKILTFETGGTSLVLGFVFAEGAYELLPLVPFLILVSSFLHLSETAAIINIGNYIRDYSEKGLRRFLKNDYGRRAMCWETCVEIESDPYRLFHISTFCLFMGMFWASIMLSLLFKDKMNNFLAADNSFNIILGLILLGYATIFIIYMYTWYTRIYKQLGNTRPHASDDE